MPCVNFLFLKLWFLVSRSFDSLIFGSQRWCIQRAGFQIFCLMDSVLDFLILGVGLDWTEWHRQRLHLWLKIGFGMQSSALWINLMTFHPMFCVISLFHLNLLARLICFNTSLLLLDEIWNLIKQLPVWQTLFCIP